MNKMEKPERKMKIPGVFPGIIKELSEHIRIHRYYAAKSVNREQIVLYFICGKVLSEKVKSADWGDRVLSIISGGIQNTFPGIRGFSISNLKNMRQFFEAYAASEFSQSITGQIDKRSGKPATFLTGNVGILDDLETSQSITGQLSRSIPKPESSNANSTAFFSIGFTHHILLLQKCPAFSERLFYMQQAAFNQWSIAVLRYHIESGLYRKKGKLANNFAATLPAGLTNHALEVFKDEYLLNFVNVNDADGEEVLENELIKNLRDFLMSLGREFAFLGNQYRIVVEEEEFFVDLLFFHRQLQSLVAIELKAGKFRPEYAGKMNFYLEALDTYVRLKHEQPSIGIILCREKKNTIVEFAFKRVDRPMGVATYVLDDKLPPEYRNYLPTAAQLKKAASKGIKR